MRSRAVEAGERSTQGRERGSEREREKPRAFCLSMRWASSESVLLCAERGQGDCKWDAWHQLGLKCAESALDSRER